MNDFLKLNENIPLVKTSFCFSFFEGFRGETRARLWAVRTFHATSTEFGGFDNFAVQTGVCCPELGVSVRGQELGLTILAGPFQHRMFFGSVILRLNPSVAVFSFTPQAR